MIYKIQYDKEHLLNATNFTLQKTLRRLVQNASTFDFKHKDVLIQTHLRFQKIPKIIFFSSFKRGNTYSESFFCFYYLQSFQISPIFA